MISEEEDDKAKKRPRELYVSKENSETSLSLSSLPYVFPDSKDLSFIRRIANRIGEGRNKLIRVVGMVIGEEETCVTALLTL